MSVCTTYIHIYIYGGGVSTVARRGIKTPGATVTGSYKPPNMDAGKVIVVLSIKETSEQDC